MLICWLNWFLTQSFAWIQSAIEWQYTKKPVSSSGLGWSFGFCSLLETCSGSRRGEATICQYLYFAWAAERNWLKGCWHKIKNKMKTLLLHEKKLTYLFQRQRAMYTGAMNSDLTAKKVNEPTKLWLELRLAKEMSDKCVTMLNNKKK